MSNPKTKQQFTVTFLTARQVDLMLAQHDVPGWRVARAMGVAPATFSNWKLGVTPRPPDFEERLRRALRDLSSQSTAA